MSTLAVSNKNKRQMILKEKMVKVVLELRELGFDQVQLTNNNSIRFGYWRKLSDDALKAVQSVGMKHGLDLYQWEIGDSITKWNVQAK